MRRFQMPEQEAQNQDWEGWGEKVRDMAVKSISSEVGDSCSLLHIPPKTNTAVNQKQKKQKQKPT